MTEDDVTKLQAISEAAPAQLSDLRFVARMVLEVRKEQERQRQAQAGLLQEYEAALTELRRR